MAGYLGPQSCVRDMARSRNCFKITEYQRSVLKVLFESWHKAESGPAPAAHIRDLFVEKSFARHRPGPCRACVRPCVPWFDNHWAFCPEQIGARSCSMGGPDCLGDLYQSIFIPSLSSFSRSEAPECVSRLLTDARSSPGSLRLSSCLSRARTHFSNFLWRSLTNKMECKNSDQEPRPEQVRGVSNVEEF